VAGATSAAVHPPAGEVRDAVARALAEDLVPLGDLTSALLPVDRRSDAAIVSRASGIVAGRRCADEAFSQVDPTIVLTWSVDDGDRVVPGQRLAEVSGPLASLLTAERTALNFLGHLSGIATATRRFVDVLVDAGDDRLRLWDTRKTTPGLRSLEKAAVRAGGAQNHRGNLSDWVMFKDNHLAVLGIPDGVARARDRWPGRLVHVECDRLDQVEAALDAGADAVLLDNMTPDQVRDCVAAVDRRTPTGGRRPCLVEISGGITIDTIASFAGCGADLVSTGSITNSAPVLDIGLDIVHGPGSSDVAEEAR
jgi:nicotinate-nucleotide pyrophosphorylase (carboxylating)